ncbi:MAG TPA: transglutaminase N-terminal domain-containing protein, partial [Acidimicrobiales bacterium]|nr:transglutaminase N-terminal domain-containing protein [Acidimicrobiales bacterium]
MTFKITHRTTYTYESHVTLSYGLLHMIPRDLPGQACLSAAIRIEPNPDFYQEHRDFFGNRVGYFEIRTSHRRLSVLSTSEVNVTAGRRGAPADRTPWEAVRDALAAGRTGPARDVPAVSRTGPPPDDAADPPAPEALDARQFVLGSPLASPSRPLREYALESFTPLRPVHEALLDLIERVHDDFRYEPGVTAVSTTVGEAFEKRAGVCQDFAHVV